MIICKSTTLSEIEKKNFIKKYNDLDIDLLQLVIELINSGTEIKIIDNYLQLYRFEYKPYKINIFSNVLKNMINLSIHLNKYKIQLDNYILYDETLEWYRIG